MSKRLFLALKFLFSVVVSLIIANAGLPFSVLIGQEGAKGPGNLSEPIIADYEVVEGDFYVATDGDDTNEGTFDKPLASIECARDKVRNIIQSGNLPEGGLTICIKTGEYHTPSLNFDSRDSGKADSPITYRAYGDGPVTLNGGIVLKTQDFEPANSEARVRLPKEVREKVLQIDLSKYALTADDWGKLYAIGAFNIAHKYDGDTVGPNMCELIFNDKRMTLARYPNENNYFKIGDIIDMGEYGEFPPQNYIDDWKDLRNPRGATFKLDKDTNDRVNRWASIEDTWIYGFFFWDWADASSPIKAVDTNKSTLTTLYGSQYGFRKGAICYFYNIFEELDTPGEWYLDRDLGLLYLYPPEDMATASINLSLSTESIITLENADYLSFVGFDIKGTRADAVTIKGNNCAVEHCRISNCAGNAIMINGENNLARSNEICFMGKGGIKLSGGDRKTLKAGNNLADNNLIHHYGEIYKVYSAGISLSGVGNTCSHNEIHDAPHMAITYSGNDQTVEYNNIYRVVTGSSDAGAIYSGRDFTAYGCVVRYNAIYDIGSKDFKPDGIYFDDAQSGQSAYGNILVNIPKYGILIGGGRDINVSNNIFINCTAAIHYDDRARQGALYNGWFSGHVKDLEADMWKALLSSPYKSEIWSERYPQLALVSHDFADSDNPYFAVNPAFSKVKNNIVMSKGGIIGYIAPSVYLYSFVGNNGTFPNAVNPGFIDLRSGDYRFKSNAIALRKVEAFEQIPFESIGRY